MPHENVMFHPDIQCKSCGLSKLRKDITYERKAKWEDIITTDILWKQRVKVWTGLL
jgi:hypothetical protein